MSDPRCRPEIVRLRHGIRTWYLLPDQSLAGLEAAMAQPGDVLKESHKTRVRRVGDWVVKESCAPWPAAMVKHTFRRNRYRQGWIAAHFLAAHGVGVAAPIAYAEDGFGGILRGNVLVSRHLAGCVSVQEYLHKLIARHASPAVFTAFFAALAEAVNRLTGTGAYHSDLAGKNILTQDGRTFWFIDLDAVVLSAEYTDERRLVNHVQLYSSFCTAVSDHLLTPFLVRMLPGSIDPRVWMPQVRAGQRDRCAHSMKRRQMQGLPALHNDGSEHRAGGVGKN